MSFKRHAASLTAAAAIAAASFGAVAAAKTSHAGWPKVDKAQLKIDHTNAGVTFTGVANKHNELLGGHGSDTLIAGRIGDILWGDFNPSGQNETQVDTIRGGAGKDFIYASHGKNVITSGGGADQIHAHFGRGTITCASPKPTIFLSHKSQKGYKLKGCPHISFKSVGH
jgi:RTX calcium-binding nonapeptide repeat (4 copies)